jgi:ligand-binding sensor domain-containing protein
VGAAVRFAHAGINAWTSIGPADVRVNAIAIDPTTPTTLYAGTNNGVVKSTDGGMSWQASSSGRPGTSVAILAIDQLASQTLYAVAFSNGVFKSTDGGLSWSATNTGLADLFVGALAIAPHTLYAGISDYSQSRGGVFRSTNGGESWQDSSSGLPAVRAPGGHPFDHQCRSERARGLYGPPR